VAPVSTPIVGICRFSFLGRGDWHAWSGGATPNVSAHAKQLYARDRMEKRFWAFENLLLKSVAAQSNPDFHLIVLTSSKMPKTMQTRLRKLTETIPQVRLVISDAGTVGEALLPATDELWGNNRGMVQFRIDDDDCLATDYVARLADFSRRMKDFGPYSYSRPRGLVLTAYNGASLRHFDLHQPFNSMGTAVYLRHRVHSVFSFGHLALQARFPSFQDNSGHAFLALKWSGHDSLPMDETGRMPRGQRAIGQTEFAGHLARQFPFVDLEGLSSWMGRQLA
jgi:hypothetical protein